MGREDREILLAFGTLFFATAAFFVVIGMIYWDCVNHNAKPRQQELHWQEIYKPTQTTPVLTDGSF